MATFQMSPLRSVLLLILLAFGLTSCGRQEGTPSRIDEGKFLSLYTNLLKNAQNMRNWGQDPRTAARYADSILANAGVSRQAFDETIRWYNADVRRWKSFSEAVIHDLDQPDSLRQPHP
jgi:hypothetical protein